MSELNTPVEIDSAIALQGTKVARCLRDVRVQEHYRDSDSSYERSYGFDESKYAQAQTALREAQDRLRELNDLYTGWPRYYHVTNTNGHIHTSMACSSCFFDTEFAWRTDLSGLSVEEVVEREAYNACTVCMPIAPAEQKAARERFNAEQREAKRAEKQAKADEKLRKAAIRAQKLLVKVEKAYEQLGGVEAVAALPSHGEGSLYRKTFDFPATVADVLMDDDRERRREGRRYNKDPRKVIAEAQAKGLL